MSAFSVVEALDVIKDISSGFGVRFVSTSIDPLSFEHAEEAFSSGIISTTASAKSEHDQSTVGQIHS